MKNPRHIYILSALVLVIAAIFSSGYIHFDEHFQILEFAGYKLGINKPADLAWEFNAQMRPAIQPAMVVLVYKVLSPLGLDNPFFVAFLLRLISAALTFIAFILIYRVYKDQIKDELLRKWFFILSFLLWFAIFNGVRFSSENWSGIFFIFGFSAYFLWSKRKLQGFLLVGILLGLSFAFRYQTAFLLLGFGLWLLIIQKEKFLNLLLIASGILLVFGLSILIDHWFYGEWTIAAWNYLDQNIIQDKVSGFGTKPFYWYFPTALLKGIPPFSLLFVVGTLVLIVFKPKSPLVWSIGPFILIHSIIGHKEHRFLFPIILFMPIIMIRAMEIINAKWKANFHSSKGWRIFMKTFFIVNILALGAHALRPADAQVPLYKKLYRNYSEPTTLHYYGKDPYYRVLYINFYKRPNLKIKPIDSLDRTLVKAGDLLVLERRLKDDDAIRGELIYSSYPDWLYRFNFNNWLDRTRAWYVYEISD